MMRSISRTLTLVMVLGLGWSVAGQQPAAPAAPAAPAGPGGQAGGREGGGRGRGGPVGPLSSVTKPQLEEMMKKYSNWGRWGKDDEKGTLNLITPAKRIEAAKLVRTGTVVSMAKPIVAREVAPEGTSVVTGRGGVESAYALQNNTYVRERQEMEFHGAVMTHYDALCHVSHNGVLYNGLTLADTFSLKTGCAKMDGSTVAREGVISRGIFLDMPGVSVTTAVIEAWEKKTGIRIGSGDVVILKSKQRGSDNAMGAGWDPEIFPWLKQRDVAVIGHDQSMEGGRIEGQGLPMHAITMVALGMPLIDHMALDDMSIATEKMQRWEFMFVMEPLPIKYGSGSAVNPLAIF
jgi:kynurenine formamidase